MGGDDVLDAVKRHRDSQRREEVPVLLKTLSGAPALAASAVSVGGGCTFGEFRRFVLEQCNRRLQPGRVAAAVFVYINDSFEPEEDALMADLFDCFRTGSRLIASYSLAPAFA